MPFLRAATRNLSPESSAQSKVFNLKRVLFCRGNQGQFFQQNRPISAARSDRGAVIRMAAIDLNSASTARASQADIIDNMLRIGINN